MCDECKEHQNEQEYETCVVCGELTDVKKSTPIDFRYGYVEGAGQTCSKCFKGI